MKFSIVLATLNRSDVIKNAVSSIINQTIDDFEIIIIDQSEDNKTYDSIKSFFEKYENISYHKVNFKGLSRARNYGIGKAKGEFICLMDDDAEYNKHFLMEANRLLNKNNYEILSGMIIDRYTNKTFIPLMDKVEIKEISYNDISLCPSASLVIKRNLFNSIGMFDENLGAGQYFGAGEETDLLVRALDKKCRILYSKNMIVYHPYPTNNIDDVTIKRAFTYGLGEGALNKKCIYNSNNKIFFIKRYGKSITKTSLAIFIYIYDKNKRRFYKSRLKGLLKGFKEYK